MKRLKQKGITSKSDEKRLLAWLEIDCPHQFLFSVAVSNRQISVQHQGSSGIYQGCVQKYEFVEFICISWYYIWLAHIFTVPHWIFKLLSRQLFCLTGEGFQSISRFCSFWETWRLEKNFKTCVILRKSNAYHLIKMCGDEERAGWEQLTSVVI